MASISPLPRARPRCCSAATAPARPRRCAPSWDCGRPRPARSRLPEQRIEQHATPDIARLGVGYVPESMAVFSDLTVKENLVLAARDGPLDDTRLEWIFGFFPALKRFWLSRAGCLSGGQKQMLSIARAVVEPRKLLLDRRADQGPCAGDHRGTDRMLCRNKTPRRHHSAGRAEFPCRATDRRHGAGDGQRKNHSPRRHGGDLANDVPLQERLLGLSLEAHQ